MTFEAVQQRVGLAAWGALAALQVIWHGWLLPPTHMPTGMALAVGLIPLAIPLWYWRAPLRALIVAGLISLLYFCHGVVEAMVAPPERVLASIEIVLAVVVILACARRPRRRRADGSNLSGP